MIKIAFLPRNEHHFRLFEDLCVSLNDHKIDALILSQFGKSKNVRTICFSAPFEKCRTQDHEELIKKYKLSNTLNKYIYADRDLTFFPRYYRIHRNRHKKRVNEIIGTWLYEIDAFFRDNPEISAIFSELKAGVFDGLFHEIAKFHKVDYFSIRQSKLTDGIIVCDPDHDLPLEGIKSSANVFSNIDLAVEQYLHKQKMKYDEPSYLEVTKNNHKFNIKVILDLSSRISFSYNKGSLRGMFTQVLIPIRWFFAKLITRLRIKYNMSSIFETDINFKDQYVVYPFHYEPESSVTIRGFPYEQTFIIELISKSLPYGCKVFVKEHKGNRGYRKFEDYAALQSLHNVVLIPPDFDSFNLVKNSIGVITITGRMGWEALLIGKPVITFGKSFWSNLRCVVKVEDIKDFNLKIQDMFAGSELQPDELRDLIKFYLERTFPGNFVMKSARVRTDQNIKDLTDFIIKILA